MDINLFSYEVEINFEVFRSGMKHRVYSQMESTDVITEKLRRSLQFYVQISKKMSDPNQLSHSKSHGTVLGLSFSSLASVFTKDAEVLRMIRTGILFVSASQPINALAFIFDGLHFGVSDFSYAAVSMMLVGAVSSSFLLYASTKFGLPGVWSGLTLFMGLRMFAGFFRIMTKNGPWWFLHGGMRQGKLYSPGVGQN